MNILNVLKQCDRECMAQLVFVIVQDYQQEQLLLYTHLLPDTIFLVGNAFDTLEAANDMLPDFLLLDTRLLDIVKSSVTQYLYRLSKEHARVTPRVANICIDLWREKNKEKENLFYRKTPELFLECLLATSELEDVFISM
jgi:hypothetical protein